MDKKTENLNQSSVKEIVFYYCLCIVSILLASGLSYWQNQELHYILRLDFVLLILDWILILFIRLNRKKITRVSKSYYGICGTYIFSLFMVLLYPIYPTYNFWMFGPILIALLFELNLALLYDLLFVFLLVDVSNIPTEEMAFHFVLCTLILIVSKFIQKFSTMIYVLLIAISSNITLLLILHDFDFDQTVNQNMLFSVGTTVIVILLVYWIYVAVFAEEITESAEKIDETVNKTDEPVNENPKLSEEFILEKDKLSEIELLHEQLQPFAALNHPLMLQLQSSGIMFSEQRTLYEQALKVGDISARAAKKIGADELLARLGGYYHAIGKLLGSNYIVYGIELAKEYHLPNELVDIIKQHNIKVGRPQTPEAAIVMITLNALSSLDYLKESHSVTLSPERIISNLFDIRLSKGNLDASKLTVYQYKQLKEFYTEIVTKELEV